MIYNGICPQLANWNGIREEKALIYGSAISCEAVELCQLGIYSIRVAKLVWYNDERFEQKYSMPPLIQDSLSKVSVTHGQLQFKNIKFLQQLTFSVSDIQPSTLS